MSGGNWVRVEFYHVDDGGGHGHVVRKGPREMSERCERGAMDTCVCFLVRSSREKSERNDTEKSRKSVKRKGKCEEAVGTSQRG